MALDSGFGPAVYEVLNNGLVTFQMCLHIQIVDLQVIVAKNLQVRWHCQIRFRNNTIKVLVNLIQYKLQELICVVLLSALKKIIFLTNDFLEKLWRKHIFLPSVRTMLCLVPHSVQKFGELNSDFIVIRTHRVAWIQLNFKYLVA